MLRALMLRIQETLSWLNPQRFEEEAFRTREMYKEDYRYVADSLLMHIPFDTAYDVGCANGFLLGQFLSAGKFAHGVELSAAIIKVLPAEIRDVVEIGDFSEANGKWDLVCCVEVAEHVLPSQSEPLVLKLTELAHDYIYFTSAPPGQTGVGHINCRPQEHWIKWFQGAGWIKDIDRTSAVREDLQALTKAHWLRANSIVFKRR